MKKKLMRTLLAGVLACALILPTACNNTPGTPGGENPGGENPGGENPGGQVTETASLSFEKGDISLKVGATEEVKITATKIEDISFESNKPQVATAALKEDKTALTVTAAGQGTAKITAKAGGKDLASLNVTVTQDVKITAKSETIDLDVENKNGYIEYDLNDSSATVTAESKNTQVVTVGEVNPLRKQVPLIPVESGTAEVTLTATNGSSTDTATVTVTVKDMYDTADTSLFTFEDDGNGGYIISLKDKDAFINDETKTSLIIPSKYENKPVTEIKAQFLFSEAVPYLTELYIPATVKVIGESAFEGCALLTTVHVKSNSSLTTISAKAFGNCVALSAFDGMSSENFDMERDFGVLTHLRTIGNSAFYQHNFNKLYIPKSVTLIEDHAFAQNFFAAGTPLAANMSALESVYFEDDDNPDNAVWICTEFYDKDGNHEGQTVDGGLGPQTTALACWYGCGVFTNNIALESVHFSNVAFCASNTFGYCLALKEIYIDASTAADAFKERGTNNTTQGTGYAYWWTLPATNTAVFTIDNAVIETITIRDDLIGDSAGIFGCRGAATGGSMGCAGTVYVKDTLNPSDSFKQAYTKQETSDKEGYTCWTLNQ